eukprot:scaffold280578_cov30-Tisochrysis_lutea.AAC.2
MAWPSLLHPQRPRVPRTVKFPTRSTRRALPPWLARRTAVPSEPQPRERVPQSSAKSRYGQADVSDETQQPTDTVPVHVREYASAKRAHSPVLLPGGGTESMRAPRAAHARAVGSSSATAAANERRSNPPRRFWSHAAKARSTADSGRWRAEREQVTSCGLVHRGSRGAHTVDGSCLMRWRGEHAHIGCNHGVGEVVRGGIDRQAAHHWAERAQVVAKGAARHVPPPIKEVQLLVCSCGETRMAAVPR